MLDLEPETAGNARLPAERNGRSYTPVVPGKNATGRNGHRLSPRINLLRFAAVTLRLRDAMAARDEDLTTDLAGRDEVLADA